MKNGRKSRVTLQTMADQNGGQTRQAGRQTISVTFTILVFLG